MNKDSLLTYYYNAKHYVFESGFFEEAYYQEVCDLENLTKANFYREYAWVVLSSGLSEKVIISVFDKISRIFNNWKNPAFILKNEKNIFTKALKIFNNKFKVKAIIDMARFLIKSSSSKIIELLKTEGVFFLKKFSFLGPATSLHLAKNIGLNFAKPDRHLIRISNKFGFDCVNEFCSIIAQHCGDKKSVIDIILWRFATLERNYMTIKYE